MMSLAKSVNISIKTHYSAGWRKLQMWGVGIPIHITMWNRRTWRLFVRWGAYVNIRRISHIWRLLWLRVGVRISQHVSCGLPAWTCISRSEVPVLWWWPDRLLTLWMPVLETTSPELNIFSLLYILSCWWSIVLGSCGVPTHLLFVLLSWYLCVMCIHVWRPWLVKLGVIFLDLLCPCGFLTVSQVGGLHLPHFVLGRECSNAASL